MDRINSKVDKQAIYEIYRACRLCGAGAGYKMPIIQNVLDVDCDEVELKHKILECVQIEVTQDDKMPPLICELCVDKVNDFYEFMDMCRQTNKRTRLTLGLPLQTTKKDFSDNSDCILGVTEPVFVNREAERSSPRNVKTKGKDTKAKVKTEMKEVKVNVEIMKDQKNLKSSKDAKTSKDLKGSKDLKSSKDSKVAQESKVSRELKMLQESIAARDSTGSRDSKSSRDSREFRFRRQRSPSPPPRPTRQRQAEENATLSTLKTQTKKPKPPTPSPPPPPPKSILKKPVKEEELSPTLRSKRPKDPPKPDVPVKKVKLSVSKSSPKPRAPPPPAEFACPVCQQPFKSAQAVVSHTRVHTVTFTSLKLACNSCSEWFESSEAAAAHHKRHTARGKPYICRGCRARHTSLHAYNEHTSGCVPWVEEPDVSCGDCGRAYPTLTLRERHRCPGEAGRVGGKCSKCSRHYSLYKNLKKHESSCTVKRKSSKLKPEWAKKLREFIVLVSSCDPLLDRKTLDDHYYVAGISEYYGLAPNRTYPFLGKTSFTPNNMVKINAKLDDFYCEEDYIHWDSDVSDDEATSLTHKEVDSLFTLALKTIFSRKCLGRVPRKRRKIKEEKNVFDSLLTDFDNDMSTNIDSIIDNLGKDEDKDGKDVDNKDEVKDDASIESDSLLDDSKFYDENDEKTGVFEDNLDENKELSQDSIDSNKNNEENIENTSKSKDSVSELVKNIDESKHESTDSTDKVSNNVIDSNESEHFNDRVNSKADSVNDLNDNNDKDNEKVNGDAEDKSDKLKMDEFTDPIDSDIDDKKLMAAIDEHIGDDRNDKNDDKLKNNDKNSSNDKITLDDLIPSKNETKSLGLDSISDEEFNFD